MRVGFSSGEPPPVHRSNPPPLFLGQSAFSQDIFTRSVQIPHFEGKNSAQQKTNSPEAQPQQASTGQAKGKKEPLKLNTSLSTKSPSDSKPRDRDWLNGDYSRGSKTPTESSPDTDDDLANTDYIRWLMLKRKFGNYGTSSVT